MSRWSILRRRAVGSLGLGGPSLLPGLWFDTHHHRDFSFFFSGLDKAGSIVRLVIFEVRTWRRD